MLSQIPIKKASELKQIKKVSDLTTHILDEVNEIVKPGVSTQEIDDFIREMTIANDAVPATLGYKGYPKSCCTSINDVICHGIPSPDEILKEGDILNIDVTCKKFGMHGDSSRMFLIGGKEACQEDAVRLVEVTRESLYAGIQAVAPGNHFGDIGAAISDHIEKSGTGFSIVREFTGHGLGRKFHEPPQILHIDKKGTGAEMKPGMVFTIEPMINVGNFRSVISKEDGWTARTIDGSLSAQWEHTIAVTKTGFEIYTLSEYDNAYFENFKTRA